MRKEEAQIIKFCYVVVDLKHWHVFSSWNSAQSSGLEIGIELLSDLLKVKTIRIDELILGAIGRTVVEKQREIGRS